MRVIVSTKKENISLDDSTKVEESKNEEFVSTERLSSSSSTTTTTVSSCHNEPNGDDDNNVYDETWYLKEIKIRKKLVRERMMGDGNCLFRAIARQVYGDQTWHDIVRRRVVDYMKVERDHYQAFITENFETYIKSMRCLGTAGSHAEIQAISELFNRTIETYSFTTNTVSHSFEPINVLQECYRTSNAPIRLFYSNGNHYDALIDPYEASIGVGLGLPGLQPGKMERDMIHDAKLLSEKKNVLDDKAFAENAITEAVLRESLAEYWKTNSSLSIKRPRGEKGLTSSNTKHARKASIQSYPQSVEDLVCNGFSLEEVLIAFEMHGDNFDDMLSFLISRNHLLPGERHSSNYTTSSSSSSAL